MKNFLQKRFVNFLVKHLYNTISVDDILVPKIEKARGGRIVKKIYLKGKALDNTTIDVLRSDADRFSKSSLWKLLSNAVKNSCNERMYYKGKTDNDILAGKMGLYILKTLEDTMEAMRKM